MTYNYSIIIPHKNIPDLLIRCLNSIPKRDDVQVIIVDDNSKDADTYTERYPELSRPNVEFYPTKEGKGAGYARNVALSHVKGKWLICADSDDFFNYCFNDLLTEYCNSEADIVYFNANSVDTQTYLKANRDSFINSQIKIADSNPQEAEFNLRYYFGAPWCKIVRSSIVFENSVCFDETPCNNDTKFSYLVGTYARSIVIDKRAGYCLTDREGSISKGLNEEKIKAQISVFSAKQRFFLNRGMYVYEMFLPQTMKRLKAEGNSRLFNECLEIMRKNGFDEKDIYSPYWVPKMNFVSYNRIFDFTTSSFGQEMIAVFESKAFRYNLFCFLSRIMNKINR